MRVRVRPHDMASMATFRKCPIARIERIDGGASEFMNEIVARKALDEVQR